MKTRITIFALALFATSLVAQTPLPRPNDVIQYTPVTCITPDQLPVFQLSIARPGDLRAYFRLVNTTEWCWVQGNNVGPVSTVVLPKFRPGQEVEYFFVLLEGKRVIARSPVLYRVKATDHCDTLIARHSNNFIVDCSHEVSGAASSFMAGNAVNSPNPCIPHISPQTPEQPCAAQ